MPKRIVIDGSNLTIERLAAVARLAAPVGLSAAARARMERSHSFLERLLERGEPVYGVTTGTGDLAAVPVSRELGSELQRRIVVSHAAGCGAERPVDVVRAGMLCRANTLAKGHSGVRAEAALALVDLLNAGITPVAREKGSLGASGDLAPLCDVAMVVVGCGQARLRGEILPGTLALKKAGLEPLVLSGREGVALINGSQMMTGELALRCRDAENILRNAIVAAAMTADALRSVRDAFDARVHDARPFPGQRAVAGAMRRLTEGSRIMSEASGRVQDAYSLRCIPQILGPSLDALAFARRQTHIEMNAACDNPLFFPSGGAQLGGGNFHGQPIALAADFLKTAICEVASLSERHVNRLLNPALSGGLPAYLVREAGLNSGLMGAQFTAAALVSENKVLAHPGVVDTISVSGDEEDHVSMGPVSVRTLGEICRNATTVVAIEMLCAAQAVDLRLPKRPGAGVRAAHRVLRSAVPLLERDRPLTPDIERVAALVESGVIVAAAERAAGAIDMGIDG